MVESSDAAPDLRRGRAAFRFSILFLFVLFAITIWQRNHIRAYWWAMKLESANDLAAQGRYLACLSSVGADGLGAVGRLAHQARPDVRMRAVYALQSIPDGQGLNELSSLLADVDLDVRQAAATAMAFTNRADAVNALADALRGNDANKACAAAAALGRVDREDAMRALCEAARNHPIPVVRAQALEALADIAQTSETQIKTCDSASVFVAALDDSGRFRGTLAREREREAAGAFAAKMNPVVLGSPHSRPATTVAEQDRMVADMAAACLTEMTGQARDWKKESRDGLAARCRIRTSQPVLGR